MPKAAYRSLPWFMSTNENLFFIFANFNWCHVIFRFRVHLRLKMAEENYWKRRVQWSASIKSVNFLKEFLWYQRMNFNLCVVAKQIKTTQCFLMYTFCLFVCFVLILPTQIPSIMTPLTTPIINFHKVISALKTPTPSLLKTTLKLPNTSKLQPQGPWITF